MDSREGKILEKDARVAMKQIVSAVDACHDLRIVHRDLKPENLRIRQKRVRTRMSSSWPTLDWRTC